jgi:hypothetical protein
MSKVEKILGVILILLVSYAANEIIVECSNSVSSPSYKIHQVIQELLRVNHDRNKKRL